MYIGNYLSSLFALKNSDFPNSLVFSELALKSKNNDLELLENHYNSSIILGKINKSLEIISEIELLSDTVDNKFLYPTISEQIRRNDLISAYEVSNKLGLEKHNIFIKKMISIWKYVASGQKGNALSLLDNFINENNFRSEVFLYLKIQGLLVSSFFDDIHEVETRYNELKKMCVIYQQDII